MNPLIKRLTESEQVSSPDKNTPLPIIVEQRPVDYYVCPHCKQEIFEKHTYVEEGVERHAECKGAIKWPPTDWSKIDPQWRALLGGPK